MCQNDFHTDENLLGCKRMADSVVGDAGMKGLLTFVPWLARERLQQSDWRVSLLLLRRRSSCLVRIVSDRRRQRRLTEGLGFSRGKLVSDPVVESAGAGAGFCGLKGEDVKWDQANRRASLARPVFRATVVPSREGGAS